MELRADNLVKKYKKRTVVDHVSVTVEQGEIVGLLGPNGAGKTTSFYMIVGLIKPNEGNIFLDNEDITKLPMYRRSKLGIGYLADAYSMSFAWYFGASAFSLTAFMYYLVYTLELREEKSIQVPAMS